MGTTSKPDSLDIQFNRGLRQDLEADLLPPGALVTANNVEFDKSARLRRRDGYTSLGQGIVSKTAVYSGPARRTALGANGERVLFCDDNTYLHIPDPAVDGMCEAGIDKFPQRMPASLVSKRVGGADQSVNIVNCDICINGYLVIAYMQFDQGLNKYIVYADIIDVLTGAYVLTGQILNTVAGVIQNTFPVVQVRVVPTSTGVSVLWASSTAGVIKACPINLSATPIVVGAEGAIITDAAATPWFDAAPTVNGNYIVAYSAVVAAVAQAKIQVFSAAGAVVFTYLWLNHLAATWVPVHIGIIGAPTAGDKIFAAGYGATIIETVRLDFDLTNPVKSSDNVAALQGGAVAAQLTVGRTAGNEAIVAWSPYLSENGAFGHFYDPRGHLWIHRIQSNGLVTDAVGFANYSLGSKFVNNSDFSCIYAIGRFNDPTGFQSHYMLLDFGPMYDPGAGGVFVGKPSPVCHIANGQVPVYGQSTNTGINGMVAGLADELYFAGIENVGSVVESGQQVGIWKFQSGAKDRFLSCIANRSLIVGGGTPLIYDGRRLIEPSFYSWPCVYNLGGGVNSQVTTFTVGGLQHNGIYQYKFVYEWTDGAGNRHQSTPSPAVSVDLSASGTQTNKVRFTVPTLHATRKQHTPDTPAGAHIPVGDNRAPVRIIAYRTKVGQSTFFRVPSASLAVVVAGMAIDNTDSTASVTLDDGADDNVVGTHEILYASLPNSCPPPSVALCIHGRRLWGADRENNERIWCTKTFTTADAPGYNAGLQVIISGCGNVNGLASQDGKLYALTSNGVYLASYGDGPDNTGQGTFPEPTLITTTATCDDARGVITGSDGIYFTGPDHGGQGIYLIRRGDGNPISIGLYVRDELKETPQIRGVIDRPDKGRMEFLFVDNDFAPNESKLLYYHYDLPDEAGIGQWTVALYRDGIALESLGQWPDDGSLVSPGRIVNLSVVTTSLNGTETVAIQDGASSGQDSTTFSPVEIETGDIRPFGIAAYGQVATVTLLATAADSDADLIFEASFDSGNTWVEADWGIAAEIPGNPFLRRWEPATKKLQYGSVRYRFSDTKDGDNPGNLGVLWHGISLETLQLGGNVRLGAEKNK